MLCVEDFRKSFGLRAYQINQRHEKNTEITKFIEQCEDPVIKRAMTDRFLKGKSWAWIATMSFNGTAGEDCYRKMVYRYLAKMGIKKKLCKNEGEFI